MRQAIVTRFFGPTDHRQARVKATAQAGSCTVLWDYELGADENHRRAAEALAARLGWFVDDLDLAGGGLPDGKGYAFILL